MIKEDLSFAAKSLYAERNWNLITTGAGTGIAAVGELILSNETVALVGLGIAGYSAVKALVYEIRGRRAQRRDQRLGINEEAI